MFKFELYTVGHIKYIMHMCLHYMNSIYHNGLLIIYCGYAVKCVCSSLVLHYQKEYVYCIFQWGTSVELADFTLFKGTYIHIYHQSTHKHVHTYVLICTCTHIHRCRHTYTVMHTHTCTHIHAHTYIHTLLSCILSPPGLPLQLPWQTSPLMIVQGSSCH